MKNNIIFTFIISVILLIFVSILYFQKDEILIYEPNLYEQPKYYQNTEFFPIKPEEIINC